MRAVHPAVLLFLSAPALAGAAFSTKQLGAGGGYTHPSSEASDYMEAGLGREAPRPAPEAPAPAKPEASAPRQPSAPPQAPASPAAASQTPSPSPAPAAAPERPSSRGAAPSLWNGLVRPLAAASGPAPAGAEEAASAEGASEYDGRPESPALDASLQAPGEPPAPAFLPPQDSLFVSIEVDPGEAGTLRDAVAGLGAAGFSPDTRFEARQGAGRAAIVTGWLPAARLAEAVSRPGVRRVSVETSARPAPRPAGLEGAFLIGLRVADAAHPEISVGPALDALSRDCGLREGRVLGLETAPGGGAVAVVSARLPISKLSRVLARAEVVKILPAPPAEPPPLLAAASLPAKPTPGGFARFVAKRGLWLVLLTAALALLMPAARSAASKGLDALVPYH